MPRKKPPRPSSSPPDRATAYARAVVAGKIVAGPAVRDAAARHLRDLVEGPGRGLTWDLAEAEKSIRFFESVLFLNGGRFEGAPFLLVGWQAFVIGSIFGWKAPDGFRRFRVAYAETGKGSGKSPLAAGIGMKGLVADNEPRAEVYAGATKKDQAMILFRDAVAMFNQSPELKKRLVKSGTGERVWNLAYLANGSFFRPISADDGQSGPRPHVALIDELHEHKKNLVVEMLRAGTKSRTQALIFMITNSGSDKTGPCWSYHEYAIAVAAGTKIDDGFFGFVCDLDPGDDPITDESCWPKANPSLQEADLPGVKYLREQVTEARGMPAKESIVRRLNFCQWTDAEAPWLSMDVWKGATRPIDWETMRGRRAWAGLDLSSTQDLCGLTLFVEPAEEGDEWSLIPFAWLPDEGLARKGEQDKVDYVSWKAAGLLQTTPGRAISKRIVAQRLSALASFFEIVECAYDRWRIEDFLQLCIDDGITLPPMVPFGQGYKDMSPAVEEFERALLAGRLVHPGHPVLNWCATNAVVVSDDAGNRKLSKEKATGRIDLIVGGVMAVGRAFGARDELPVIGADYELMVL